MDPRALCKRTLLGLLVYLALLACWPLVRALYAPAFRATAEMAVGVIDPLPSRVQALFEPGGEGLLLVNQPDTDTTVHLHHMDLGGADATFGASSFFHAYHPTVFLLALFLGATPLPWRVRRTRLLWALLLLHVFFALRCALAVYNAYCHGTIDGHPVVELSPAAAQVLAWTWHFLWEEALTTYLVPLALWSLLVFALRTPDGGRSASARA